MNFTVFWIAHVHKEGSYLFYNSVAFRDFNASIESDPVKFCVQNLQDTTLFYLQGTLPQLKENTLSNSLVIIA